MQCVVLPLNAHDLQVTSYIVLLLFHQDTFLLVPYNGSFMIKLSTVKALGCVFTACPTVGSSRIFYYKNEGENHLMDSLLLSGVQPECIL